MATNYHVLEFPLKEEMTSEKVQSIDFLPYGTRTLKIKVTNPDKVPDVLVLRSEHLPDGFGDKCFFSHEQCGTDFQVSWGGGHEKGACLLGCDRVKEVSDEKIRIPIEDCKPLIDCEPAVDPPTRFVHLNVTHTGGPFDRPRTLLLVARPEDDSQNAPIFKLPVRLETPKVSDPVHLVPLDDDKKIFTFQGKQVPAYLGRWWSEKKVMYREPTFPRPDLVLQMEKDNLDIAFTAKPDEPIIQLHDNVKLQHVNVARDVRAELYHFTKHFFVLRLWFFWLWEAGLLTEQNEIPDAERYDFVIDNDQQRVVYAATDTHWREAWAPAPSDGSPVEAEIGLFSGTVLSHVFKKVWPFGKKKHNGWLEWVLDFAKHEESIEAEGPRIPPAEVVRKAVEDRILASDLGPGVFAHVPYFRNCGKPESIDFVSSDPRKWIGEV